MLRLTSLNKFYNRNKDNELHVLRDLDLSVQAGEMLAIMGKSGCGKSTLLNILGCIDRFDSGAYLLNETAIQDLKDKELARLRAKEIAFVLQDFALIERENVFSNVTTPLYFDSAIPLTRFKSMADTALEKVGIADLVNKKVWQLSGGQKQRVAIARALINEPTLLLADEPTGSLDSETSGEVMSLLKEINNLGTSIILVTHDSEIASQCSRIVEMRDGILIDS